MIGRNVWLCATPIAAMLSAVQVMSALAATDLGGTYSSVRYVRESGDDLGMEVEVRTKPQPTVVVTICEGGCWGGKTWPAVITDRQISFSVMAELVDQDGKPATPRRLSFVGRFEGSTLILEQSGAPTERLKRVARPIPGQTARLGCNATTC